MELIEQLNCGKVVKGLADCYPNRRETQIVNFSPERINALLGTNISSNDMKNYLALLDIMAEQTDGGRDGGRDGVWSAVIPTFRTDIEREADLAEEIARLYGYDKIPVTLESGSPSVGGRTTKQRLIERVKQAMVTEGYCEILTFPFESPKFQTCDAVRIINPLGDDYSVMRTTMLNSVLNSMALNYSRRNSDVRLFETAKVYLSTGKPGELPQERETLALAAYGKTDFYETKGSIERLFNSLGLDAKFEPCSDITHMHPGRAARILLNDIELGCVGELHPNTSEKYEINERVYYAEIGLPPVFETAKLISVFKPLPKFPAISRDIAMKVKEDITVNIIENTIRERAGKYLESVQLFDVYKGSQIESGYKSVAYSLSFRAPDRTLTDNEASDSMRKI
jgi:phenylalanyl-tRNA synthetase beta chain